MFASKSIHNGDLRREYSGQSPLSSLPDNTDRQMTPLSYLQLGNTVVSSIHPQLADWTMKEQQQTGEVISLFTVLSPPLSIFLVTVFACSNILAVASSPSLSDLL